MANQKAATPVGGDADLQEVFQKAEKVGSISEAQFMSMLNLMVAKEARLAQKEAALEVALQARDANRKIESENYTIAKIEAQKNCKHLKGGKGRTRAQQRDPNVYAHTFTDGKIQIKCNGCGARWLPGDTDEYLTRNGSKIPNWTNIGWRRAQEMAEESSNRQSSSERFGTEYHASAVATEAGKLVSKTPNLQL